MEASEASIIIQLMFLFGALIVTTIAIYKNQQILFKQTKQSIHSDINWTILWSILLGGTFMHVVYTIIKGLSE